jgi:hypothetical protein
MRWVLNSWEKILSEQQGFFTVRNALVRWQAKQSGGEAVMCLERHLQAAQLGEDCE